jgi:chromosomal replication initiator protein
MSLFTNIQQTFSNLDEKSLWKKVSARLIAEFGEEIYNRWLAKLELVSASEHEVIMSVPSKFLRDWIKREYLNSGGFSGKGIAKTLIDENPNFKKISIIYSESQEISVKNSENKEDKGQIISLSKYDNVFTLGIDLNPKFTFENFIVGKSNQLAYNMARVLAGDKKTDFIDESNPLFLYGGVGLGKTHLAQAVAWYIKDNNKNSKVIYLSAERFMYQFVQSLRNKDIMEFKERIRSIDVLIIDDLQFIDGKDGTQEELLYTLNNLVENNKKIILVCDRSPGDLKDIDEKLRSRVSGGMIVDFKCPDYETRLAILKAKTKSISAELEISETVFSLLASKINSNIRDLEGALKKMIANNMFTGEEINVENAKTILKDLFRTNHNGTTIEAIQKKVAEYFSVKIADLKSTDRSRNIARPRQIAMYFAKNLTSKRLPDIGREFGGKNHATVIHAVKKVEELMFSDSAFAMDVKKIEEIINS